MAPPTETPGTTTRVAEANAAAAKSAAAAEAAEVALVKAEVEIQRREDEILHLQNQLAAANIQRHAPPAAAGGITAPATTAVSFKLPPFYLEDPLMWYTQSEAVFRRRLCRDPAQRFDAVVEALPPHIAIAARDIIFSVDPDTDPAAYQKLKDHLLSAYGKTKWQLAAAVLDSPMLGDRKPTAALTEMRANKPPNCQEDTLFQLLFIRCLPHAVGSQIMAADLPNVDAMAAMADRIIALPRATPTASNIEDPGLVAAVTSRGRSPTRPAAKGGRGGGGGRGGNAGSAGRGRGGRAATPGGEIGKKLSWCKYHILYEEKAEKCISPCNWFPKGN